MPLLSFCILSVDFCVSFSFSCQICFVLIDLHPVASITQPPVLAGYLMGKMALQKRWDFDILEEKWCHKAANFHTQDEMLGEILCKHFGGEEGKVKQLGCLVSLLWISPLSCNCCAHLSRTLSFKNVSPVYFAHSSYLSGFNNMTTSAPLLVNILYITLKKIRPFELCSIHVPNSCDAFCLLYDACYKLYIRNSEFLV